MLGVNGDISQPEREPADEVGDVGHAQKLGRLPFRCTCPSVIPMSRRPESLITDRQGRHEQAVPLEWFVPGVAQLKKDSIYWPSDPRTPGWRPRVVRAGPGMLTDFYRLATAPAEAIRAYSDAWGPLGLCEHGLPVTHGMWDAPTRGRQLCLQVPEGYEPVATWRYWARQAGAIATLSSRVRRGTLGKWPTWQAWYSDPWPWASGAADILEGQRDHADGALEGIRAGRDSVAAGALSLASAVSGWLRLAGVGIEMRWDPTEEPRLAFSTRYLFGALGLSLAGALAGQGLAICAGCRTPFAPTRRPAAGARSWCETCREQGKPHRAAQARYVHRPRQAAGVQAVPGSASTRKTGARYPRP